MNKFTSIILPALMLSTCVSVADEGLSEDGDKTRSVRYQLVSATISTDNRGGEEQKTVFKIDTFTGTVWFLEKDVFILELQDGKKADFRVQGWTLVEGSYGESFEEFSRIKKSVSGK